MISVKKDFAALPDKLFNSDRLNLILDSVTTRNTHKFKSSVYRNATLDVLEILYNKKCAYCETNTSAGAPMQVEHYRSKAKVTEDITHYGYYWIAYEWSNLILSCSKCNRKKANFFPITGTRISSPVIGADGMPAEESRLVNSLSFINEGALLLNPEIDNVETHFLFKIDGKIEGVTSKADETIIICGLNRKELVFKRLTILNEIISDIKRVLTDLLSGVIQPVVGRYSLKLIFEKLASLQDPKKEYSRFGYFLFYKFEIFIADSLEQKQKEAVKRLFDEFLKGNL